MQNKLTLAIVALAGALLSAPLIADDAATPASKMEVTGKYWMAADTNGDGVISKEEYMELSRKRAEAAFNAMDSNHDGNITPEELSGYYTRLDTVKQGHPAAKQTLDPSQKPK